LRQSARAPSSSSSGDTRRFPSFLNSPIEEAARDATQEADSLIALLGIVPGQLHRLQGASAVVLPSVLSLLAHTSQPEEITDSDTDSVASDTESLSEAWELQHLIDQEENINISRTGVQDDEMMNLTCAALAITADEMMNV
jgi:hypothetical protein